MVCGLFWESVVKGEKTCESEIISKTDLRKMQGN